MLWVGVACSALACSGCGVRGCGLRGLRVWGAMRVRAFAGFGLGLGWVCWVYAVRLFRGVWAGLLGLGGCVLALGLLGLARACSGLVWAGLVCWLWAGCRGWGLAGYAVGCSGGLLALVGLLGAFWAMRWAG